MAGRVTGIQRSALFHPKGALKPIFWVTPGVQQLTVINQLGPDRPVYGVYREKPEAQRPPLTFQQIAAYHVETIRSILTDGPYAIVGYCVYGAIAFEVARELTAQGQTVAALILIDPSDPALSQTRVLPQPITSWLIVEFNRLMFHLSRIRDLSKQERRAYVARSLNRIGSSAKEFVEMQMAATKNRQRGLPNRTSIFLLDIHQSDIYAFKIHILERYPESVVILRPRIAPKGAFKYPNRRWQLLVGGEFDIEEVPGDGDSMWTNPHARVLSQQIAFHLNESDSVKTAACDPELRQVPSPMFLVDRR